MKTIVFNGMRRSGNHAVITWFIQSMQTGCVWYNDISPARDYRKRKTGNYWFDKQGDKFREEIPGVSVEILSYEDKPVIHGDSIVIVRDIYNVTASRLAKAKQRRSAARLLKVNEEFVANWLDHARLALDQPARAVVYNHWVQGDRTYLGKLAATHGLDVAKACSLPDVVPSYPGIGSSYSTSSQAGQLGDTATRYRGAPTPRPLWTPDVARISWQLFGWWVTPKGHKTHSKPS